MGSRKQNTSCDECRKARLGCNASSMAGRCSNCIRRNRNCNKEWIHRHLRERPRTTPHTTNSEPGTPGMPESTLKPDSTADSDEALDKSESIRRLTQKSIISPFGMEETACRRQQGSVLHHKLWDVFSRIFEPRLALVMASGCCPYPVQPTSLAPELSLWQLVTNLDLGDGGASTPPCEKSNEHISDQVRDDDIIKQALVIAVHAFSIRWLSLYSGPGEANTTTTDQSREDISDSFWHRACQIMYSIMSRPSYRSILALQIFAITPVPSKNADPRIRDLCADVALNQQNPLQSVRNRSNPSFESSMNTHNSILPSSLEQDSALTQCPRSYMQDRVFWFSVTCDTTRSLMQCRSSILLSNGTGDSKVWNHVRLSVQRFDMAFKPLRHSRIPLSDELANIILQHASAGQKMFSGAVVQVQNALYRQEDVIPQETALNNAFQQLSYFKEVFILPLEQCAREFMFLNEQNQISYGKVPKKLKSMFSALANPPQYWSSFIFIWLFFSL